MPRVTWLIALMIGVIVVEEKDFYAASPFMFAELLLQVVSSYYMLMTVSYGIEHRFYSGAIEELEIATPADLMYRGALMWSIVIVLTFFYFIKLLYTLVDAHTADEPKTQRTKPRIEPSKVASRQEHTALLHNDWKRLEERLKDQRIKKRMFEESSSTISEGNSYTTYDTIPVERHDDQIVRRTVMGLYLVTVISMLLLWGAQWAFWVGFINLSLEEYVCAYIFCLI